MRQIIRLFKNEKDFYFGQPQDVQLLANENEEYSDTFVNAVALGIAWGAKIKYARPVAAVYEVAEDGSEKLVKYWVAR